MDYIKRNQRLICEPTFNMNFIKTLIGTDEILDLKDNKLDTTRCFYVLSNFL